MLPPVVGRRCPDQVPLSPFVQPPSGAVYVPLAEFPSEANVPENTTTCPFSFRFMAITPVFDSVPLSAADVAQGVPLTASCPEILLPVCAIWPVIENERPKTLDCAETCQLPAIFPGPVNVPPGLLPATVEIVYCWATATTRLSPKSAMQVEE